MATYTTATLVKLRIENIDSTLTDGNIEDFIEEAEQILNTIMGISFLGSFDVTKHGILRAACNAYAAYTAVIYNPAGFTSTSEASLILDTLWEQWLFSAGLLIERTFVEYLESL